MCHEGLEVTDWITATKTAETSSTPCGDIYKAFGKQKLQKIMGLDNTDANLGGVGKLKTFSAKWKKQFPQNYLNET